MIAKHPQRLLWWIALLALTLFSCESADRAMSPSEKSAAESPSYEGGSDDSATYAESPASSAPARASGKKKQARQRGKSSSADGSLDRLAENKPGADEPREEEPDDTADRMVVYTAWMTLAVHEVESTLAKAAQLTIELGGYVQSSTPTEKVLRVPSARYEEAVTALKGMGEVRRLRQESEDITEAYSDIVARIDNLEALEARFETLLAQAETMQERLAIERHLRRVRQELRELRDTAAVMADLAAFATITLSVTRIEPKHVVKTNTEPQPFAFVRGYGLTGVYN